MPHLHPAAGIHVTVGLVCAPFTLAGQAQALLFL